jgi:hypothetical protein
MGTHQHRRSHSLRPRAHLLLVKIAELRDTSCSAILEALIEKEAHGHIIDVSAEELEAFKTRRNP